MARSHAAAHVHPTAHPRGGAALSPMLLDGRSEGPDVDTELARHQLERYGAVRVPVGHVLMRQRSTHGITRSLEVVDTHPERCCESGTVIGGEPGTRAPQLCGLRHPIAHGRMLTGRHPADGVLGPGIGDGDSTDGTDGRRHDAQRERRSEAAQA